VAVADLEGAVNEDPNTSELEGTSSTTMNGNSQTIIGVQNSTNIPNLLFYIKMKKGKSWALLALTRDEYVHWYDGLNLLIYYQQKESSTVGNNNVWGSDAKKRSYVLQCEENKDDFQILVRAEETVRKMNLEGLVIPKKTPVIPKQPNDFNFCNEISGGRMDTHLTSL